MPIAPSICHWATKEDICKPGHLCAEACLIYQPVCVDMERSRLNSVASSCSDKQGQASLGAQAITQMTAHCGPTNRLPFASCFVLGLGPMLYRENYIVVLTCQKEKNSLC